MASSPLFDSVGRAVAFLRDDARVISLTGQHVAWIRGQHIYDYQGRHRGWWYGDHARGPDGGVMVWLRNARLGIVRPIPQIPPIPPIPAIPPLRPLPSLPPLKPLKRMGWSEYGLLG
jgi:hypothetical protein